MSQGSGYDLTPPEPKPEPPRKPRPGDPDFVPPVPVIIRASAEEVAEEVPADPDVHQNKALAILGYVFFVIPLVAAPNSKFARYHANQGLMVFILWVVAVVGSVVLHFGWELSSRFVENIWAIWFVFGCLSSLLPFAMLLGALAATIFGIIQAANGEKKGLPLIGHMTLIK